MHVSENTTLVEYARKKAKKIIEKETNIGQNPDITVMKLRRCLQREKKKMSERTYRYLCRELSYLMAHDRGLHAIANANSDFLRGGTFSSRVLDENAKEHSIAEEKCGYSITPEEIATIRELVSGKHLSDIENLTVSQATLASAMELYPLDTVRWLKERRPNALTPEFAEVLGQHTMYGMNAYDIEQFVPKEIKNELPQNLQSAFDLGIMKARSEIKQNILQKKEKFAGRPLPTQEDEARRRENSSRYSQNTQQKNEILQNLFSVRFQDGKNLHEKCFEDFDNITKNNNRMYEYNLRGPAPLLSSIPQNPQMQNVAFDGSSLKLRPFYPNMQSQAYYPEEEQNFTSIWNTCANNLHDRVKKVVGTEYLLNGKPKNFSEKVLRLRSKGIDCSGLTQWNLITFMENMNEYSRKQYNCSVFPERTVNAFKNHNVPLGSVELKDKINAHSKNKEIISKKLYTAKELESLPYNMLVMQKPKPKEEGKYGHIVVAVRNPITGKFLVYESTSMGGHAVRIIPYDEWRSERRNSINLYNTMPIEKMMDPNALKIIHAKDSEAQMRQMTQENMQEKFFKVPVPNPKRHEEELQVDMRTV